MIADPFNLLLILFPFSNFLITYSLLIIFKFLACGIFMYVYLRHKKITPRIAIPISALYMIGGFLLFTFPRHPDLSNGAIYLPLIILGVELIFDNKKPYLLLFSTFFCFISVLPYQYRQRIHFSHARRGSGTFFCRRATVCFQTRRARFACSRGIV